MKVRVLPLILAGVGLTLGISLWLWRSHTERRDERELDQGLSEIGQGQRRERSGRARANDSENSGLGRRTASAHEEIARELVFTPPPGGDPGELDAQESVEAFTEVMDELEQAADDDRKLDREESAEYYNRANGSFKAMSAWIDGNDPRQRGLLEKAHKQMLDLLRRLDIRPPAPKIDEFVSARDR